VLECILTILYDSFWPIILWLSPLLLLVSLSESLALSDIGRNPLQRPTPPWHWELSCGLSLPPDPPWKNPRIQKRKQPHFFFIQREQNRLQNARNWKLHYRKTKLNRIPWGEDMESNKQDFSFDPLEADRILHRIDPLEYYHHFSTVTDGSFLSTSTEITLQQRALVAAADLRATFKAADNSGFPIPTSQPYVLHTADDSHLPVVVDTGASISISPNVSDFVGPITKPFCESLQGLGESTKVDGQGIIEWQIRDVLGTTRTIRTNGYLVRSAAIRLFSPQTYFKEQESSNASLYVDFQRTELTLHDGSILTFPFANNNIPYMLTDWQPVVGITLQDQPRLTNNRFINMSLASEQTKT
jgi:hypothetical protein